jgi:hypothetical protein
MIPKKLSPDDFAEHERELPEIAIPIKTTLICVKTILFRIKNKKDTKFWSSLNKINYVQVASFVFS